jgi:UDP-N-acetylglucosamine 2-epimerase (non-hydrolysing)
VLTGTDEDKIVGQVARLLDNPGEREDMARIHNPYGDGHASQSIAAATLGHFGRPTRAELMVNA